MSSRSFHPPVAKGRLGIASRQAGAVFCFLSACGLMASQAVGQTGPARYVAPAGHRAPAPYDSHGRPVKPCCPPGCAPQMPSQPPAWRATPTEPRPEQVTPSPSPRETTPPQQPPMSEPSQSAPDPAQDFADQSAMDFSFSAPQAGIGSADVAFNDAPAMIGDFFGSGGGTFVFVPPAQQITVPAFQTIPVTTTTTMTNSIAGQFVLANNPTIPERFFASPSIAPVIFTQGMPPQPIALDGVVVGIPGPFAGQGGPFMPLPSTIPLQENILVTNAVANAFPGATVVYVGGVANEDPMNPGSVYFLSNAYDVTTTTTTTNFVSVPVPGGRVIVVQPQPIAITIPSPSASGFVVGRQKIAENTSPIPRDRVFTNYSYFDNTRLANGGVDVHRITPGFEKTFWDGNASFEMRFPFASTLTTDILADGSNSTNDTTFGNINMTWKFLLYSTNTFGWSAGMALTVPTGDDLSVGLANGFQALKVKNESVHYLPFTGFLYAPSDRLFVQGYLQADVDGNGNSVLLNNGQGQLVKRGVANDQTFLFADLGMGYWMYQNPKSRGVTGIAPIVEMHYNRSLQDADVIRSGPFALGSGANNVEVLDAVIGATTKLGDSAFLTAAYATPIGNNSDQQFDAEARVTFNWYFGGPNSLFGYGNILP